MIVNLDHVNIVVRDLAEATEFFLALGFALEDQADLDGDWISSIVGLENVRARYAKLALPGGGAKVELMQYFAPPSGRDPAMAKANQLGYRHIALEVDDIDTAVSQLRQRGVKMVGQIEAYPVTGKKLVYFYGPDDILLELTEYPEN